MFCYQCQETVGNKGCTVKGVCGKDGNVAKLQDLAIYLLKGISLCSIELKKVGGDTQIEDNFIVDTLFATITNANFDYDWFKNNIQSAVKLRDEIKQKLIKIPQHDSVSWAGELTSDALIEKANEVGVLSTENEDVRSLRELLIYGFKGMAAYAHHAKVLNETSDEIFAFIKKGLAATLNDNLSVNELTALVLECGKFGVDTMALLDKANTQTYGNPEITEVNIGVGTNPGILVSGHDLKDLEQLLEQTQGTGVDVYTHSEMLPAHYYPAFKKYPNFVGNYGNAWWRQAEEFEKFNGPIVMTTNCLVPPKDSYKERLYVTGVVGFVGLKKIDEVGSKKDFSKVIEQAKTCVAPIELETGKIVGGFAHNQVFAVADKVVDAVKSGAIKKFFVMAGCDGRMKSREYFTEFAQNLPNDTIILTAGCAKYRYNKLNLGDIGGIPRVLDAGQCNDSYSLAVIALKLKEVFGVKDINDLPIAFNIAWYEQKAVLVLLALLHLGFKNIHLGPTLPAFLSPNVATVLVNTFGIGGISEVQKDIEMFLA